MTYTAMLLLFVVAAHPASTAEYEGLLYTPGEESTAWLKPMVKPTDVAYAFVKTGSPGDAISDAEIIDQAIFNCRFATPSKVDEDLLWQLLKIEDKYNVPDSLRGMLLAAACHESGYNPNAKGDRKFSKSKRKPMAIGLFQMWSWWESKRRGYGINRRDPIQSANAYMQHITRHLKTVKRRCRGYKLKSREKKRWLAAWATAIRAPKAGGRCGERPRFYRVLRRWQKSIEQHRKKIEECQKSGIDGCGC